MKKAVKTTIFIIAFLIVFCIITKAIAILPDTLSNLVWHKSNGESYGGGDLVDLNEVPDSSSNEKETGGLEQDYTIEDLANYGLQDGASLPIIEQNVIKQPVQFYEQTDMFFDQTNCTDTDFKSITLHMMVWDQNMLPVSINHSFSEDADEYLLPLNGDNLAANQTKEQQQFTLPVTSDQVVYYILYLYEAEDFDGNIWTNPMAEYIDSYAGQKLDDNIYYQYFIDEMPES